MTLGARLAVAALAVMLATPVGCRTVLLILDQGIGDDAAHTSRLPAPIILTAVAAVGMFLVYEVGDRITRGRIDGSAFSMGYVAACTVVGLLAGPLPLKPLPL